MRDELLLLQTQLEQREFEAEVINVDDPKKWMRVQVRIFSLALYGFQGATSKVAPTSHT